jgi:uracil-DNA glycosylase family 4
MLTQVLNELVRCDRCSFADNAYPPLAPVRLADKVRVMFIGENPSWEYGQRVPFDGITNSGRALHEHYLIPLKEAFKLRESDFWITDLFKCRYKKDVYRQKAKMQKLIFGNATVCANSWLAQEIRFTQPEVIVTLGDKEVYQRFRKIFRLTGLPVVFSDAAYKLHSIEVGGHRCKLLPTCHPDISFDNKRKPIPSRKWSQLHRAKYVPTLSGALSPGGVGRVTNH